MKISTAPAPSRLAALVLGCLTAVLVYLAFSASAPALRTPLRPTLPAAPAAPAATPPAAPNMLVFIHQLPSDPFFGVILLTVSICLVSLCVLLSMDLRMGTAIPPGFVEDFTDTVNSASSRPLMKWPRAILPILAAS